MGATPTLRNMDSVLTFLPYFESEGSHFYDLETDRLTTDPYIYSPQVLQFVETLYREGFIVPFDWSAWQDEAARYVTDPSLLDSADLPTLQKLLTTHVRADRFSSGHLAQMIECGHILAVLRRLKTIRDTRVG
jgi:hypothetical protein